MKFASFEAGNSASWGVVDGDSIVDMGRAAGSTYPDLKSFLGAGDANFVREHQGNASRLKLGEIRWLPVIPKPEKILCVGLNYEMHRKETGRSEVQHPTIFGRFANSQTGHQEPIVRPRVSTHLDFEGELAVIIGKKGRYIQPSGAMDYIAGFACFNDASVRDFQSHTHQFTPGKNFPHTGACGPWMVTPDEVGDLKNLRITTTLNGEIVQDARFGQMIFDVPTIVEYCSSFTELEPGDVIATGTPGGVGAKRTPPLWMRPGDIVEVAIERVGVLKNPIADE